jgi:hypothetical protein
MASVLKVDKLDPQSGTALEIGTSGDTVSIPSGATLDISASTLTPPATMPASSGINFTALNATNLGSGTVPTARLGTGTADSSTFLRGDQTYASAAAQVKHINATRDMTTASGTQAITGVGFTPNAVVVNAMVEASNGASWGTQAYDQQGATADYSQGSGINWTSGGTSYCINLVTTNGSTNQKGHISSWDADGATITWLKAGSPTGTAHIRMLFIA